MTHLRYFHTFIIICLSTLVVLLSLSGVYAQTKVQGRVIAPDGSPISEVLLAIDNGTEIESNSQGRFEYILPVGKEYPEKIEAKKKGYRLQNWGYDRNKKRIQVLMWPAGEPLGGKVVDLNGKPIANISVILSGVNNNEPVLTDKNGNFAMQTPPSFKMNDKVKFIVDGIFINPEECSYDAPANSVTIHFRHRKESTIKKSATTEATHNNKPTTSTEEKLVKAALNPTLVVVVYNNDLTPAKNLTVYVDNKEHTTDERGEFKIMANEADTSNFSINAYQIVRKEYDEFGNYVYLYVQDANIQEETDIVFDSAGFQYDQNFNFVFNKLEAEKQILQEHGTELRKEIEIIHEKLERERANMSEEKRRALQSYMRRLENALIENDLAYETVQKKTKTMLEKMKASIVHKDSIIVMKKAQIEEKERKLRFLLLEVEALAVIAVLLVIFGFIYYRDYRKIHKQHIALEKAHQEIKVAKEELEHATQDILAMRDIGRELTSQLDFHSLTNNVYKHISKLFPSDIFGIGIYNQAEDVLEYKEFIREGRYQPAFDEKLDNPNSLAAWSLHNNKEIVINNIDTEITNFLPNAKPDNNMPKSVCYIPLVDHDTIIGALTVQSYQPNAYQGIDMQVLRTLGSYLSVATSNAKIYEEVRLSKQKITDSIRYAQTIQNAILPSHQSIRQVFSDFFVLYKPKDIVSGDFYWFSHLPEYQTTVVAVADCTGHGVSGAFMSMIGNTLLNEIVNQKHILDADQVLNLMNVGVVSSLKQEAKLNDDGMDVGICIIKHYDEQLQIQYSGAKRPLYVMKKGQTVLETFKGDNKSVGGIFKTSRQFTKHEFVANKRDKIYLTSDGYTHQNNINHNKIGTVQFKKLIEESSSVSMAEQLAILENALLHYLSGTEQRDDITVLGIEL